MNANYHAASKPLTLPLCCSEARICFSRLPFKYSRCAICQFVPFRLHTEICNIFNACNVPAVVTVPNLAERRNYDKVDLVLVLLALRKKLVFWPNFWFELHGKSFLLRNRALATSSAARTCVDAILCATSDSHDL